MAGKMSQKFGRVKTLIGNEIFIILLYGLMFVENLYAVYLTRFLSGITVGFLMTCGPCINSEMMPSNLKVAYGVLFYNMICLPIMINSGISLLFLDSDVYKEDTMTKNWRFFLCWPIVVNIIRLIIHLLWYKEDTVQFYFEKYGVNQYSLEQSKKSLEKIYTKEDSVIAQEYLIKEHENKLKEPKISFKALFTKNWRKAVFACVLVQFFQQFSGINFLVFYSVKIFNDIGQNGALATFILMTANFLGSILAIFTNEKFGRKINVVIGILIQGIAIWGFSMMIYFQWFVLIYPACIIYMVAFAVGCGGASFIWCAETLPPVGVGLVMSSQWLFTAIIGMSVPILSKKLGVLTLCTFFTAGCIIGCLILDWLTKETKGKNSSEIKKEYLNGKYKPFDLF